MKNDIRYVAGLASALLVAACSGGAAAEPGDFQAPSAPDAPPAPPAVDAATPPPPPAADAGSPAPQIAKHCNVTSATTNVCIENVAGHAGDTVDVPIFLIGDATCGMANEADGHVQLDLQHLSLTNDEELVGCRTHHVAPSASGTGDVIQWNAFGDHALAGCADIPIGKVDTLQIKIAAGTPAGDYTLSWQDADFIAPALGPSQCTSFTGTGMNGIIRVLP